MPIMFNLEMLRERCNCKVYLETGLYDPSLDISCKKALSCNFDKVYTVEVRKDFIDKAKEIFNVDIKSDRLHIIQDDSINLFKYIINDDNFVKNRAIFFLDAHYDNIDIERTSCKKNCPIMEELEGIKLLDRKDHIICIDDVRYFNNKYPWGETSHGDIHYIDAIKNKILSINENYKFTYLNGYIENDVLLAYIE